jgi:CheY-like chemotaxis protein
MTATRACRPHDAPTQLLGDLLLPKRDGTTQYCSKPIKLVEDCPFVGLATLHTSLMNDLPPKRAKESGPSVLVIDDDPIILEVARERLTAAGFAVSVREEVLGTTRWLAAHPAEVILLDVMMPALDGSELATLLKQRAQTKNIAVILHSSLPTDQLAEVAERIGAAGYISKSTDARSFVEAFRGIVTRATR